MAEEETQAAGAEAAEEELSLLESMLDEAKIKPQDEGYDIARQGIQAFITEMLAPSRKGEKVDKTLVDAMIAEIDKRITSQVNQILHHPEFQKLESSWRGLRYLIDNVDFRENIKVEVLNVSKNDLREDFEDAPEIPKSGLYQTVYSAEYGTFGGSPYGLMIANYEFDAGPQDIQLLQDVASVATMAHAPFISNTSPKMFGCESYEELPKLKGSPVHLRGAAVPAGTASARAKTRATSASPSRASCCACPTGRTPYRSRPSTSLKTSSGSTTPICGGTTPRCSRRGSPSPSPSTAGVPTSSALSRWRRLQPQPPPVRGDGRDPDEDPDRDSAH